jgi:hypothetical protein
MKRINDHGFAGVYSHSQPVPNSKSEAKKDKSVILKCRQV